MKSSIVIPAAIVTELANASTSSVSTAPTAAIERAGVEGLERQAEIERLGSVRAVYGEVGQAHHLECGARPANFAGQVIGRRNHCRRTCALIARYVRFR